MFMFVMIHTMKYWRLYFQGKNYIVINLFWEEKLKLVLMRVNVTKICFPYYITVSY